ncbi:DJ-1/PfpI family protein [Streptococcus moroccensis]|uniref:Intracellular protease/amidase n=1 Tax=Streptococcus moroccensis TaxID=1451356 RepID=A0ABT9YT15_9STRE|nr:DJ-1/PfpI family protein [Streptococcus moroccensis]MDQ0222915.1 putative intracellular protease/amidase [Streptococcus moroccensis]
MKKVACLLYPNFSLYEIAPLTSTLVLHFGIEIDYIASNLETVFSEDGLPCVPTKTLSEVQMDDYSCLLLPGMIDFTSALLDDDLIQYLANLDTQRLKIAAISSAPILLAKAGLLDNATFTGGLWQNFFDYFDFLPKENFRPLPVCEDKNIITGTGFSVNAFSRKVLESLDLVENADSFFREKEYLEPNDLIFTFSESEFQEFKQSFEKITINNR